MFALTLHQGNKITKFEQIVFLLLTLLKPICTFKTSLCHTWKCEPQRWVSRHVVRLNITELFSFAQVVDTESKVRELSEKGPWIVSSSVAAAVRLIIVNISGKNYWTRGWADQIFLGKRSKVKVTLTIHFSTQYLRKAQIPCVDSQSAYLVGWEWSDFTLEVLASHCTHSVATEKLFVETIH